MALYLPPHVKMKLSRLHLCFNHRRRPIHLLLSPIERVSILLGHKSMRVTERHYAPWISARQEQLEADVRRTWKADPIAFQEDTKGTPEVHEKEVAVN